jgi:integrase
MKATLHKSTNQKRGNKRRGPGEGSVFQLADGRWRAQILVGYGKSGGALYKTFEAKTRAAVQEKLTANLHLQNQGRDISPEKLTVAEFLKRWLDDCVQPRVRVRTFQSYRELVEGYIIPHLGSILLQKLGPMQIQAFLNRQLRTPKVRDKNKCLSPLTVQYLHSLLKSALDHAMKFELVMRNVAKLVDPPRVPHYEVTPFTPDQAKILLSAAEGDRFAALYSVAVAIGLRQGEALALRWTDIDLERGTLTVKSTLQKIGGKFQLLETKTKRSRRTIRLPEVTRLALAKQKVRQELERQFAGAQWEDWGLVFTALKGGPIDQSNLLRHFRTLRKKANLPAKFRFHDLRHTCASLLIAQGVHPRQVMEILGHSDIRLTMNTYAHLFPAMGEEAAGKMDAILAPATPVATVQAPESVN